MLIHNLALFYYFIDATPQEMRATEYAFAIVVIGASVPTLL
jgi:hypothetical protein